MNDLLEMYVKYKFTIHAAALQAHSAEHSLAFEMYM